MIVGECEKDMEVEKLTIAQLKWKIRKMGGNCPPSVGRGKTLRQPYIDEMKRLMEAPKEDGEIVTTPPPVVTISVEEEMDTQPQEIDDDSDEKESVNNSSNVMEDNECGASVEKTDLLLDEEGAILPNETKRIIGREMPCRDPASFLQVIRQAMASDERHTFRRMGDDFVEKATHQVACCDCKYDIMYDKKRREKAGSSVMYCVQCSLLYRGVCRYVVCRSCRMTYEERRKKKRRARGKHEVVVEDEDDDDSYISYHEELLFAEWRRLKVTPFYQPWEKKEENV